MCWRSLVSMKKPHILIASIPAMPLTTTPSLACTLVDVQASMDEAISTSGDYFIASIALCLIIASIDAYERRLSIPLILSIMIVIFHPWWTVAPFYSTDCSFINVEASQAAGIVIAGLLIFRAWHLRKRLADRKLSAGS